MPSILICRAPVFRFVVAMKLAVLVAILAAPLRAAEEPAPEPAKPTLPARPVPGWVPLEPGEHPRLLFRKSDLPALRQRAQTPEGQAILARLRATLGGGEAMPTILNPAKAAYSSESQSSPELRKEGAYTISHAAGFGFLYQLTGERRYAELAQKCVELALAGQRDRDDRYALISNGEGQLRIAPSYAMYALAYDLCYDAWSDEFRKEFVTKLFTINAGTDCDLRTIALKPRHGAASNHAGATTGGVLMTLLAVTGDPNVDQQFVDAALARSEERLASLFTSGWGDAGWFAESSGPSHVSSNSVIMPALQSLRNATGRDYTQNPAVRWMTMRWAYDLYPGEKGRPHYLCRQISRNASYGTDDFVGNTKGGTITHGGWFSEGFGVISDEDKPALLWTYQNLVAPAMQDHYDIRNYPHRAIQAFINWPIGLNPKNPAEVLPRVRFDTVHGYASFRNRWQDENDIIVSAWACTGPRGYIGKKGPGQPGANHGEIMTWAYGKKRTLGKLVGGTPAIGWSKPDGSGLFTNGDKQVAVDFSGQAGVEALVVTTEGNNHLGLDARVWRISDKSTSLGGRRIFIMSVSKTGIHPVPQADEANQRLIVGSQTIRMEHGQIVFAPLESVAAGIGEKTLDAHMEVAIALVKIQQAEARNVVPRDEVVLPQDEPVFRFGFDTIDQAGDRQAFVDAGPNALKAVVKGAPVGLEPAVHGRGVLLNGIDNALVIDANPAIDMAGKSVSISCWFKNVSSEPGVEVVLLEKNAWQSSKTPDCYSLVIDNRDTFGFNTHTAGRHPRAGIEWNDGQWHHLVSVFDAEKKSIAIYHNGKRVDLFNNLPGSCKIAEGSAPLTLGARNAQKPSNLFGCVLDEVIQYDRPLTRGEVLAIYESGQASLEKQSPAQPTAE